MSGYPNCVVSMIHWAGLLKRPTSTNDPVARLR